MRGMRRSHDALTTTALSVDATSGETHLRHNVTSKVTTVAKGYQQVRLTFEYDYRCT